MTSDEAPAAVRYRMLALVAGAELLGMSLWFTASAAAAALAARWQLAASQVALLTTVVQMGFVAGTGMAAVLNLADVLPARPYFCASALLAAAANAAVAWAGSYELALAFRFVTGLCLAGVYPPAMKMMATWFRTGRGLAIGVVVGALTAGKASPYLLRAASGLSGSAAMLAASGAAVLAGLAIAAFYRDGPHAFPRRPFSWSLVGVVIQHRPTRLAIAGYLGHMWELYAMWTCTPMFVAASLRAYRSDFPAAAADAIAFGTIAVGAIGCVWGGWLADRLGREALVQWALVVSGGCCLAIGGFYGQSPWLLVPIAWIWGFFVIADSAQFSALVTERTPPHAVGTALTLQTSLGFLLTTVTIQAVSWLGEARGWQWAFLILALGPGLGWEAIRRLRGLEGLRK